MRTMVIILEQVCAEWLDMKRLSVRESTFARYQMIIQKHVLPELGKYTLEEISSSVVNSYTCRKLEEISTKTVRDICTILKSVLRYAEKEYGLHDIAGNMVLPKQQRIVFMLLQILFHIEPFPMMTTDMERVLRGSLAEAERLP